MNSIRPSVLTVMIVVSAFACKDKMHPQQTDTAAVVVTYPEDGIPQEDTVPERRHPPALPVEPVYKEGRAALEKFLSANTKYPEEARKNNVQGDVIIMFMVKKDGTASDFKVQKGLGYGCDEEALRVAKLMGPWNPGRVNNQPVDMEYVIAVHFPPK